MASTKNGPPKEAAQSTKKSTAQPSVVGPWTLLRWALDLEIPRGPKLLLVALLRYADGDTLLAFPKIKTLAELMRCSQRQVIRDLDVLVASGAITRQHRQTWSGNRGNLYRVNFDVTWASPGEADDVTPVSPGEGQPEVTSGASEVTSGASEVTSGASEVTPVSIDPAIEDRTTTDPSTTDPTRASADAQAREGDGPSPLATAPPAGRDADRAEDDHVRDEATREVTVVSPGADPALLARARRVIAVAQEHGMVEQTPDDQQAVLDLAAEITATVQRMDAERREVERDGRKVSVRVHDRNSVYRPTLDAILSAVNADEDCRGEVATA